MSGPSAGTGAPGQMPGGGMPNKALGGAPNATTGAMPNGMYQMPPMQANTPDWIKQMMGGYGDNLTPNYQNPRNFGMWAYGNDFAPFQNRYISNFGPDAMNPWQQMGGGGAITGWPIQPGQPGGPPPGGAAPPGTAPGTPPGAIPPKVGPAAGSMQEAIALGLGTGNSSALNALVKGGMSQESVNQGINDAMYNNTAQTNADAMDAYRKSIGYKGPVQTW